MLADGVITSRCNQPFMCSFTSWTMKSSFVVAPLKICDWPLNSSWDYFNLHQEEEEEKCKSERGTWGPQKAYFQAYIIHYHGPAGFCNGRDKKKHSLAANVMGPRQRNNVVFLPPFLPNVSMLVRKEGESKGRRSNIKKNPIIALWTYFLFWNQHIHHVVHCHFSWSMFSLHLARGPKVVMHFYFFGNRTMKVWP
jgi:hypothetical protein